MTTAALGDPALSLCLPAGRRLPVLSGAEKVGTGIARVLGVTALRAMNNAARAAQW